MQNMKKRGQGGTQAATLVVLIILMILLYLLFLPPEVRDELLEGNISDDGTTTSDSNETFLLENPGTLTTLGDTDIEHSIPAVNLFATEQAKILEGISSLYVENSWISKKRSNVTFFISDIENTENSLLSFLVKDNQGLLSIKLNDFEVFYGDISSPNPEPIKLSRQLLQQGANNLYFEVNGVGMKFWKKNKYELQNVQITADVTEVSEQLSRNTFIVTTTEKNNLKRSILRFTPECVQTTVGVLDVTVNGHSVYSSVPDCGNRITLEFSPDVLLSGENTLVFRTDRGSYLIDLVKVSSELKQAIQPVYYFEIEQSVLDDVEDGDYDVLLKMQFVDDREDKEGDIIINGRKVGLFQKDREYERNINDYLIKGNNAIRIVPQDTLDIIKIEVVKED